MISNLLTTSNTARISGNFFQCDYHDNPFIVDVDGKNFITVESLPYNGRGFNPSDSNKYTGTPTGGSDLYNADVVIAIPPFPSGYNCTVISRHVYQHSESVAYGLIFVKKQLIASPYTTSFEIWYGLASPDSFGKYYISPSVSNVLYLPELNSAAQLPVLRASTTTRGVVPGSLHIAITQLVGTEQRLYAYTFQKPSIGAINPTSYQWKSFSNFDVTKIFAIDVLYSAMTLIGESFCDFDSQAILGSARAPKIPTRVFRNKTTSLTY